MIAQKRRSGGELEPILFRRRGRALAAVMSGLSDGTAPVHYPSRRRRGGLDDLLYDDVIAELKVEKKTP